MHERHIHHFDNKKRFARKRKAYINVKVKCDDCFDCMSHVKICACMYTMYAARAWSCVTGSRSEFCIC